MFSLWLWSCRCLGANVNGVGAESKNHVMMGPGNAPLCGNVKVIHLMGVVCLCVCVCLGCARDVKKKTKKG